MIGSGLVRQSSNLLQAVKQLEAASSPSMGGASTQLFQQSKHFMTNNIILTMGEDFHYQYAHAWYKNLDKLIA